MSSLTKNMHGPFHVRKARPTVNLQRGRHHHHHNIASSPVAMGPPKSHQRTGTCIMTPPWSTSLTIQQHTIVATLTELPGTQHHYCTGHYASSAGRTKGRQSWLRDPSAINVITTTFRQSSLECQHSVEGVHGGRPSRSSTSRLCSTH